MVKKEKQLRLSELTDYIALQEIALTNGVRRLKELNEEYNEANKDYKELLAKKSQLIEDIIVLTENLDLYSNL